MSDIKSNLSALPQYSLHAQSVDEIVDRVAGSINNDASQAQQLENLDVKQLSAGGKSRLATMLAQQLRGQLPPNLMKALNEGTVEMGLLSQLSTRLANSVNQDAASRAGKAASPAAAREAASNPSLPQQALRWGQFIQKAQHIPGSQLQGRSGAAGPKGEGSLLAELIGAKIGTRGGPGLRSPKLVARALSDLSPMQRNMLMGATFGSKLAQALQELDISDPLMFIKAGALPGDRAGLAQSLGISRGKLIALLMRAELLKIGSGRNGELAMRPEFLAALRQAGIAMLGTMAALRGLSPDEMKFIYQRLRLAAGGFKNAMKGGRIPVKRDLIHWARTAARRRSDILFADSEDYPGSMGRGDAQELIQAWYLENLLWSELDQARRRANQDVLRQHYREEQERHDEEERDEDDPNWADDDDIVPELEYDKNRDDQLMCYWITDHSQHDTLGTISTRRMYVCVDPKSGALIPQYIEREELPA